MKTRFGFSYRSIQGKLTLAAVTPLLVILLLVAIAAFYLINASIVNQTQKQIRNDLNAARVVLNLEQQRVRELVRFTARSAELLNLLAGQNHAALQDKINEIRQRENLDILNLTDQLGRPFLGPKNPDQPQKAALPSVRTALQQNNYSGIVLLSESQLRQENETLADRAKIFSPDQPQALLEQRGMLLLSATRISDDKGQTIGCLYAGILLNNNLTLIDRISQLVYSRDSFEGTNVGSATIFLDKLRIATTVRLKNGDRALGTQVSPEVAETVLQRGEVWLARARVINEWYLTAYEPIMDDDNKAIGALYVGMLEKPFTALKKRSFLTLFGLLIFGCLLGGLLAGLMARRLSKPVLELASSAEKIANGEREVSLPSAGQDEIGHLTEAFSNMAEALKQSDDQLQNLNRQLEVKVMERTAQLEEKSLQLIETQEQLLRQEKLAAIGSLATGVAHEINNPAAIIRGNVEILQMTLSADASEQEEAAEIMKQVERVSLITRNLLNFAGEQILASDQVQLTTLIDEILAQISHQQPIDQVEIIRHLDSLDAVPGDKERLRQVFTNICLNALQAMNGSGTLTIEGKQSDKSVIISIKDTGPGIPKNIREKIFNPFFTTKQQGTGLGLSVSYGIIKAHGGTVEVASDGQSGTLFHIVLPRQTKNL